MILEYIGAMIAIWFFNLLSTNNGTAKEPDYGEPHPFWIGMSIFVTVVFLIKSCS